MLFFRKGDCPNCDKNEEKVIKIFFPLSLIKRYLKNVSSYLDEPINIETTAISKVTARVIFNTDTALYLIPENYYGGIITFILLFYD